MRQWHYDIINCAPPLFKPSGSTRGKQHTRSRRGDKGGPLSFMQKKKTKTKISANIKVLLFGARSHPGSDMRTFCHSPVLPLWDPAGCSLIQWKSFLLILRPNSSGWCVRVANVQPWRKCVFQPQLDLSWTPTMSCLCRSLATPQPRS